jgi:hypothetical protein
MELERLYELEGHTLLWSDPSWRPSRAATIAISVLDGAQEEGLDRRTTAPDAFALLLTSSGRRRRRPLMTSPHSTSA